MYPANKLIDLMSTLHQLVKNGYSLQDLGELPLYELEMLVIIVVADKEKEAKRE